MASSSGSDDDDSAKGKINEWQESSQVLHIFHFDCIYLCGEHSGVVYGLKTAILYNLIILEYNNLNSSLYNRAGFKYSSSSWTVQYLTRPAPGPAKNIAC